MGGDNFGSRSLCFTTRWSIQRLIQPFHISSTQPISHHKYNDWLYKVQIGVWALKWSPQPIFRLGVGQSSQVDPSNVIALNALRCLVGQWNEVTLEGKIILVGGVNKAIRDK
eukprot:scaffold7807_cov62-Cyclotella_meneghiniana.AAC.1